MKLAAIILLVVFSAAAEARSLQKLAKHLYKGVQYCDPYAHHDECGKLHIFSHHMECVKLEHEEACTYKEDCSSYKQGPCESYKVKHECSHVKSDCKAYEQEEKCDEKHVCKYYNKKRVCKPVKPSCESHDHWGHCKKYGPNEVCSYEQECGEYYTKKENCRYVDTHECKEHHYKEVCQERKTNICESYKHVPDCKKVKVDCKKGKCVKKVYTHHKG